MTTLSEKEQPGENGRDSSDDVPYVQALTLLP